MSFSSIPALVSLTLIWFSNLILSLKVPAVLKSSSKMRLHWKQLSLKWNLAQKIKTDDNTHYRSINSHHIPVPFFFFNKNTNFVTTDNVPAKLLLPRRLRLHVLLACHWGRCDYVSTDIFKTTLKIQIPY